jgi:hypothetical protein
VPVIVAIPAASAIASLEAGQTFLALYAP